MTPKELQKEILDQFQEVSDDLNKITKSIYGGKFDELKRKLRYNDEETEAYLAGIEEAYFKLEDVIDQIKIRKDLW